MTVIVNNHSGTNVILSVNQSNYLIKENDCDLVLTVENETTSFSLKREKSISAPPYKKMLLFEILGIVSLLFSKPSYYILDVSSTYYLKTNEERVTIDIIRKECSSGDIGIYDVIVAESIDSKLTATGYCVENSKEILAVFNKSTKVGAFWTCVISVLLFAFTASLIICPFLLAMYFATKFDLFISLMIIVPISSIVFFGLILGLPLHFIQKSQNKNFYRTMESAEIFFRLNEQEE
jgi:hypothetical protein